MKKTLGGYLRTLSFWLRVDGVDGPQIVTVLAEVRAHVTESGENPYEAFGPPRKYANAFSDGTGRGGAWIGACVVALVGVVASAYYLGGVVSHHESSRPLPLGGWLWINVVVIIVAVLLSWRAVLFVAVPSLASLATDDVDAQRAWSSWRRKRSVASLAVVVVILVASVVWAHQMGTSYDTTPKLKVASYVYATASTDGPNSDPLVVEVDITVRAVVYLDDPGPLTRISGIPSFSRDNDAGEVSGGVVQAFPTLRSALRVVKNKNFSFNDGVITGTRLSLGQYYVVSWSGNIQLLDGINAPTERLTIPYSVKGVGKHRLSFPLDVDFSQINNSQ